MKIANHSTKQCQIMQLSLDETKALRLGIVISGLTQPLIGLKSSVMPRGIDLPTYLLALVGLLSHHNTIFPSLLSIDHLTQGTIHVVNTSQNRASSKL